MSHGLQSIQNGLDVSCFRLAGTGAFATETRNAFSPISIGTGISNDSVFGLRKSMRELQPNANTNETP